MGQSFVGAGNGGNCTITIAGYPSPVYSPIGGPSPVNFYATSAAAPTYSQATCPAGGGMTLKGMTMQINQITGTGVASLSAGVSISHASTPGAQSCAFTNHSNTSTAFSIVDSTHTDVVAAGQTYGVILPSVSGTALGIVMPSITFEQDGATNYTTAINWGAPSTDSSLTKYTSIAGGISSSSTEAITQIQLPYGLTLDNLQVLVSANTATGVAVHSRINGASGNQSASVGSGTGFFTDATHTDAVAAGALVDYYLQAIGGTSFTWTQLAMRLVSAAPNQSALLAGATAANGNPAATEYCPAGLGATRCDTVEGEVILDPPLSGTLSNLNAILATNTGTGATMTMQKGSIGSVTGNQTLFWGSGVAGVMVDATHTDAVVAGTDQFVLKLVSSASTVGLQSNAVEFSAPAAAAARQPDGMALMGVG